MKLWHALFAERPRLPPSSSEVLARLGRFVPTDWTVALLAPCRAERRDLPSAQAIFLEDWDLRQRRPPQNHLLVSAGLALATDAVRMRSLLASWDDAVPCLHLFCAHFSFSRCSPVTWNFGERSCPPRYRN